jgi:hypothetical protein
MITNLAYNSNYIDILSRRSLLMKLNYKATQIQQDRSRDAYKKLSNFK